MDYQDIIYTEEGGIATMTLNRPDQMNALSSGMRESMHQVLEHVMQDKTVRLLIITGAGRAFCSGADVKSLADNANRPVGEAFLGISSGREVECRVTSIFKIRNGLLADYTLHCWAKTTSEPIEQGGMSNMT